MFRWRPPAHTHMGSTGQTPWVRKRPWSWGRRRFWRIWKRWIIFACVWNCQRRHLKNAHDQNSSSDNSSNGKHKAWQQLTLMIALPFCCVTLGRVTWGWRKGTGPCLVRDIILSQAKQSGSSSLACAVFSLYGFIMTWLWPSWVVTAVLTEHHCPVCLFICFHHFPEDYQ